MRNRIEEQMRSLRLGHMLNALELQRTQPGTYQELDFEERLGLSLEHELLQREMSKVARLRRQARLRLSATASGLDLRPERELKRRQMGELLTGGWYQRQQNVLITGPTGSGKTYVARALGEQACQQHVAVGYWHLPRLLDDLNTGHADGSYRKQLLQLVKKNDAHPG